MRKESDHILITTTKFQLKMTKTKLLTKCLFFTYTKSVGKLCNSYKGPDISGLARFYAETTFCLPITLKFVICILYMHMHLGILYQ